MGKLTPADKRLNGPSGKILDDLFLLPLGYTREDAWLCDLLPYTRLNKNQQRAIENHYNKVRDYDLPQCTIPVYKASDLKSESRVDEIIAELEQSQAETIILLGDLPLKHFLPYSPMYKNLSDFVKFHGYGEDNPIIINGKTYNVIPLSSSKTGWQFG